MNSSRKTDGAQIRPPTPNRPSRTMTRMKQGLGEVAAWSDIDAVHVQVQFQVQRQRQTQTQDQKQVQTHITSSHS
ncbi:hypothetical protein INS49_014051 [Diaporthe citri]|uniref:uncharacterized protein n=1 Tax=Diaporthe citri TaxID=83186 RepID=UPI001C818FAF|nr:uncharacterized protein INS49_014051 [Diaporthe citri]KAG6358167.1 hypothetical protein INS49_014051 [Diaporthe citri]